VQLVVNSNASFFPSRSTFRYLFQTGYFRFKSSRFFALCLLPRRVFSSELKIFTPLYQDSLDSQHLDVEPQAIGGVCSCLASNMYILNESSVSSGTVTCGPIMSAERASSHHRRTNTWRRQNGRHPLCQCIDCSLRALRQ